MLANNFGLNIFFCFAYSLQPEVYSSPHFRRVACVFRRAEEQSNQSNIGWIFVKPTLATPFSLCSVCNVQCAVWSYQFSVCSVQCAMFYLPCAVFIVKVEVCSIQYIIWSVECVVCSVQCAEQSTSYPPSSRLFICKATFLPSPENALASLSDQTWGGP